MNKLRMDRKGIALAAAVLAIVVIGALVTGGFYAASHEDRVSTSAKFAGRAYYFAEQGIHRTVATLDRQDLDAMTAGETNFVDFQENNHIELVDLSILDPAKEHSDTIEISDRPVGAFRVTIRRMDNDPASNSDRVYWIRSEGVVLEGGRYAGAERAVGVTVRTTIVSFPLDRAFQVNGDFDVKSAASEIDGRDNPPGGWENCPAPMPDGAAIVHTSGSQISVHNKAEIYGDIVEDPTLNEDDFFEYGDLTFQDLATSATNVYPVGVDPSGIAPVAENGACDIGVRDNWGSPKNQGHPCAGHFPVILAEGENRTFKLNGQNSGQGILLIEGDLSISGGFEFYGVVIVKGTLKSTGTGGHINGVVMAGGGGFLETYDDTDKDGKISGNSIINFSSCAVKRAQNSLPQTKHAAPLDRRAWVDLSAAGA